MKVHISRITKRYKDKTYVCPLLVHSYRDENGKPCNKTILNLSALPEHALEALDAALRSLRDLWECLSRISLGRFRIGSVFVEQLGSINKKQREILKTLGVKLSHNLVSQEINP